MTGEPHVVQLEFVFDGAEFPLGRAAAPAGCDLEVELVVPRSDGSILTFVEVVGGSWEKVLGKLRADPAVEGVRRLGQHGDGALLEVILDGRPVTTLADTKAVVTRMAVTDGQGRLVADVPPNVDAGQVIDGFLAEHPSAELVARRLTDRQAPLLGQSQFVTRVLNQFTERQLHVLRVAYDNGYFEWPRESRADDIAAELGISTPTLSQHLRAVERKLARVLFEG